MNGHAERSAAAAEHRHATNDSGAGGVHPAATYNVLSSAASLSSNSISHAQLAGPGPASAAGAPMRFSAGGRAGAGAGSAAQPHANSAAYQASQAAHAAHVAACERAEREAAHAAKEARMQAQRDKQATLSAARNAPSPAGRKHSLSISSKSHKTDMNGHRYDRDDGEPNSGHGDGPAPVPPPMSSLHRSPSFDKRLIDSARFAGTEAEEEEELSQLSCAGVLAGSCCAPTSSHTSHSYVSSLPSVDAQGRPLSAAELRKRDLEMRSRNGGSHRGWYCHAPTAAFMLKLAAVIIVILAGVLLSVLIFQYLHSQELDTFREQLRLLCLERSTTIQSHLNFSTSVLQHYLAYFSLVKGGDPAATVAPFNTYEYYSRYADVSQSQLAVSFVLLCSILRNTAQIAAYESNVSPIASVVAGGARIREDYYSPTFFDERATKFLMPSDMIIPAFAGFNLSGWELSAASAVIARDARQAARLGRFINSNRSSLLQPRGTFGFVVLQPLYATGSGRANDSWTDDEREADWIGIALGVIPMSVVIERAMVSLETTPIDLLLSDKSGPANESFLYAYQHNKDRDAAAAAAGVPATEVNVTGLNPDEAVAAYFNYGQRNYEILCTPTAAYVDTAYSSTPLIIAIGCGVLFGIVLIMVVLACLYSSMRRAMARSAQLIESNRNKNVALDLLHEAKRISDEANRSKSDFLAFLCHELRNPLHAIVAMIDFLQAPDEPDPVTGLVPLSNSLSDSQQESIDTIQNSVRMMSTIVNDALDMVSGMHTQQARTQGWGVATFVVELHAAVTVRNGMLKVLRVLCCIQSKIEAGKITFEIMRFSFCDLITTLSACEKPRAQAKGIQLLLNINPNVPPYLYGDPTRIRQVCTNLLSNSIKFTSKGYVIISLSRISVDSFSLPMMMSVEEAGESKFQSDLSRTAGGTGGTRLAPHGVGSGDVSMGASTVHPDYRPPGATPAIQQRRLGAQPDGIHEEDNEDDALLAARNGGKSVSPDAATADGELEMTALPRPPVLVASYNYNSSPNGTHRQISDGNRPAVGSPLAPPGETPAVGAAAAAPSASPSTGSTPPRKKPYTHVPLRPSTVPSSAPTLIDLTAGGDRPLPFGRDIAREQLPAAGSRLGRENSSRNSSAATFASENVIIEISVTDTGMGIDPQTLPLLFEPYSQAKLSVMRSFGGTGLGLAIVKQIVEMMQGSISVKSQVGEGGGTTMTIRLPLPTAPSFDSSSGEVSENGSHTSSKHSRSGQDVLMRRSGSTPGERASSAERGTATASASVQGSSGDDSHPVSAVRGDVSPPVGVLPRANAGAGATPQSMYSTMAGLNAAQTTGSTSMLSRSIDPSPHNANRRQLEALGTGAGGGVGTGPSPLRSAIVAAPLDESPRGSSHQDRPVVFHTDEQSRDNSDNGAGGERADQFAAQPAGHLDVDLAATAAASQHAEHDDTEGHTPSTSDVRSRLAALAFPAASAAPALAAGSQSTGPTYRPLRQRLPPNGPTTVSNPSAATAASAASKKSVAAALAGMSLDSGGAAAAAPSSSGSGSGSLAQLAAARQSAVPVHPKDLRILIVDDSLTNLKILARMLHGFNVTQAINGLEAVDRVRELILADPPLQPFEGVNTSPTTDEVSPTHVGAGSGSGSGSASAAASASASAAAPSPNSSPFTLGFSPLPQQSFVKQRERQFDVIFSDVLMPVMDGQQASREIRKLERMYHLPPVPIVALTANAFMQDREKCAAAGMSLFVSKPFSKQNIISIVQLSCSQNGMSLVTAGITGLQPTPKTASRSAGGSSSAHSSPSLSSFMLATPAAAPPLTAPSAPAQSSGSLASRSARSTSSTPQQSSAASATTSVGEDTPASSLSHGPVSLTGSSSSSLSNGHTAAAAAAAASGAEESGAGHESTGAATHEQV